MRLGRNRLRPLAETRRDVDPPHARIMVDYSRTHRRRGLVALLIIPFVMLIRLSRTGFTSTALLVCAVVWLCFAALWALGLYFARRRFTKYGGILAAADVDWPPTRART